jgi:uncharacterized integral membrane protein
MLSPQKDLQLGNYNAMSLLSRSIQWLILLAIAAAVFTVAIITAQNLTVVSFKFLLWEFPPVKLGLAVTGLAVGGLVLGGLLPLGKRF